MFPKISGYAGNYDDKVNVFLIANYELLKKIYKIWVKVRISHY